MNIQFSKYQGTGNDFVMIDDREGQFPEQDFEKVAKLCHRRFGIGADGLILIRNAQNYDFEMRYFNADGRLGSMCGNGGRCTVQFASDLGIIEKSANFLAADGPHQGKIENGLVHLKMGDVPAVETTPNYFYADTGSPHYVAFVDDVETYPVVEQGKSIRYGAVFGPKGGTNVNFVSEGAKGLVLRTYERGVEDETYACGTGATAVALVAALKGRKSPVAIKVKGGNLTVSFEKQGKSFSNIFLIGPAQFVFEGSLEI